jgi:hypothetical protein
MLSISNPIVAAIQGLYGIAGSMNDFMNTHIEALKRSTNETMRATGRILEGAKFGFGLGYSTPLMLTAIGQMILGNPLAAVGAVASGVTLSNPLAMTCGAIGAIYYGWKALSESERNHIINRIVEAFSTGAELVKAVAGYVLSTLGEFLSAEKIENYKRFITDSADHFGRTLGDVTRSIKDRASDFIEVVSDSFGDAKRGAHILIENLKTPKS